MKKQPNTKMLLIALFFAFALLALSCQNKDRAERSDALKAYSWDSLQRKLMAEKNKDSSHLTVYGENAIKAEIKPGITQYIWHDENYHLQTVVFTDSNQIHPRDNTNYAVSNYTEFSPYFKEVSGSFEYIKKIKKSEYIKAYNFLFNIPDSVSILKNLPVQ